MTANPIEQLEDIAEGLSGLLVDWADPLPFGIARYPEAWIASVGPFNAASPNLDEAIDQVARKALDDVWTRINDIQVSRERLLGFTKHMVQLGYQ